jgi:uncharacterized membrane protein
MKLGVYILGLSTVAAGVFDLIWREFEPAHQPIQALGDHIPGQQILAYITAAWLVVVGAALLWRRTTRAAAIAIGVVYLAFALFWLPRFYTAPLVLGVHASVYISVLAGMCSQLIVVAAAVLLFSVSSNNQVQSGNVTSIARVIFGIGPVFFGLGHLTGAQANAFMVPQWMPWGQIFWVNLTGVAFVLAGSAILTGILDVLAARLLALMLLVFSAFSLIPRLVAAPHQHIPWGSNAYNLAAVGSVWIYAEFIAKRRTARKSDVETSAALAS